MGEMKQRMRRGEIFRGDDPELNAFLDECQVLVQRLNAIPYERADERRAAFERLFAGFGAESLIRPHFHCDFGDGITIGRNVFINAGCVMLDGAPITVGDECLLASNVQLLTATHPVDAVARRDAWEMAAPLTLGAGVWLGAGVIVCPGVEIGENTVVGAGSVVTRSLPAGVVAYGNPARVAREIVAADRIELPDWA